MVQITKRAYSFPRYRTGCCLGSTWMLLWRTRGNSSHQTVSQPVEPASDPLKPTWLTTEFGTVFNCQNSSLHLVICSGAKRLKKWRGRILIRHALSYSGCASYPLLSWDSRRFPYEERNSFPLLTKTPPLKTTRLSPLIQLRAEKGQRESAKSTVCYCLALCVWGVVSVTKEHKARIFILYL